MKTKIKRHSRSALSILLTICMLVSCMTVGLIATDAAKVQSESVGYDTWYIKGSWDKDGNGEWVKHNITSTSYSVSLDANTPYSFVFLGNNDQFSANTTIKNSTDYNFPKNNSDSITLQTAAAGNYTFSFKGMDGGQTSMSVHIEYPADTTPTTWTAVGDNTAIFGTAWAPTANANDLTKSGTTWSKTWNNVELTNGSTIKYKVAKNYAWTTAYPSNDATATVPGSSGTGTGLYNVTVTYNESNNAVNMTITPAVTYTLSVPNNVENAVVKASYNGNTANEGGTLSGIPAGASVDISVTPDVGKTCQSITATPTADITGSGKDWTLTMPAANVTNLTFTWGSVTTKKVYFNNSFTLYGSVYAYAYNKDGSTKTYECLGAYPGTTMTKLDNSNIWYIEVPADVDYVEFVSGEGYRTDELTIPWTSYAYPKYTAPYGHNDAPTKANGGTWGNYIYGSDNKRTNEYTVSDGSTMSASNLFTGITATMYDYYVDGEIGTTNGGWLKGIQSNEYNIGDGWKWDPYTVLNQNLSAYADTTNSPMYGVTYPLYFGNLNVAEGAETTDNLTKNYYNFNRLANNSEALKKSGHNYDAVTGLTGKTLGNDTIHYYKSGVTNENGVPMAMFDEDFLSGENKTGDILATILRTSSFPVRNEEVKTLCLDMSNADNWEQANAKMVANFYTTNISSGNTRIEMTSLGNHKYIVRVPSGYTKVQWQRVKPDDTSTVWNSKDAGAFGVNTTYTFNSFGNTWNDVNASWSKDNTLAKGHTYYEYDSTDGKDNAFITNIDTTNKTATIDYYANSEKYVQSSNDKKGFFPFDYNNVIGNTTPTVSRVYLNPGVWNTGSGNEWFAAVFKPTSGSDSWQRMTYDNTLGLYYADVPEGYESSTVDFCRMNKDKSLSDQWDGKWNDTGFKDLPTTNAVVCKITGWGNANTGEATSEFEPNNSISVTYNTINNYADATNHYAHDQGFGMKLTIPFTLNANGLNEDGTPQVFDFSGDDDLWVFVDGKLVLDLGGAHAATTGSINFNTKTVTATNKQAIASGVDRNGSFADGFNTNTNYVHTMTIYYMERGMFDSNLKFGFSFHAIPNQFWIDKKIRTKDIINAGFYQNNDQTGNASNKDQTLTNQEGRFISKFEASYRTEAFEVTHKVGDTNSGAFTAASGKKYTIDNDTNTYTTPTEGTYPIKHDLGNAFIGQFTTGQYFNLKESPGSNNKYVYTPKFSVWDQANNNQAITPTGNNTNGYTFQFNPTTTVSTAIENTNIKARFENYMVAHTLTLTKKLNNPTDETSTFTLQVLFDFENDNNYIAYPLYCDLDGVRTQLSKTGTIEVKAGQTLEIEEIPEKAKIQVTEVLPGASSPYAYSGTNVAYASGAAFDGTTTLNNGVQFAMGAGDMKATINNAQADAVIISHDLKTGSVGDADTYVTAVVTNSAGTETKATYAKTTGKITVEPTYIKKGSTDKLVITLETTPIGYYAFEHFWEQIGSTLAQLAESGTPYTAVIEENKMKATVTVVVGDLFNATTGAQLYTELPFYSSLVEVQKTLTITKKLTTGTDATSAFNINITKNGSAYSGAYKLNETASTTTTGVIPVHQNDTITIEGLHVGENVAVFETDIPFNYQFSKATLGTDDNTNVAPEGSTGYAFTVNDNTALTIWNEPIVYHYSITYSYDSYRNLHKTQKYKVTGDFDKNTAKVADYLKVSDTVYDDDSKTNVTSYWFKDDTARKNFINILGPYENNYMEKLYWNTDMKTTSNTEGVSIVYNSSSHTYTIDVNVIAAKHKFVDLTLHLPYDHDVRGTAFAAKKSSDGKVHYNNALPDETISNLDYGTWYAQNGVKYGDAGTPQHVTAPLVIYDGDQAKGFKYWTVKTVANDLYDSIEYTKCYYREFNLSIYQDSIVEPHYENITAEEAAHYTQNPHAEAIKSGNANGAVVTFIENSRNQYNMSNNNISQETRRQKGDRIYTDFLLSFASEGDLKFQDYANGTYTAGLAIQKVAELDDDGQGGKKTKSTYYANKYGDNLANMRYNDKAFSQAALESFIKGTNNVDKTQGLERSQFDANKLDNKNRIQYYYSYSVRNHQGEFVDNGNKDYVYRAFAFMKDKNGNVTMVSQPLYFTFYDMASIANAQVGYGVDFPTTP